MREVSWPRRFTLLAAAAALAGCASLGSGDPCTAPQPAAAGSTGAPTGELRVLSWNVHGMPFDGSVERRTANIVSKIREMQPDVVLLEEVWLDAYAARFMCEARDAYQAVPELPTVRSGPFAAFGHRRGGLLALIKRNGPWRLDGSVAPRFTEYAESSPWYYFDQLDGIAGKGVQSLAVTDGARRVVLLHTHVQTAYPGRGEPYEEVRSSQLAELLAQAREASGDAVLVVGDLNVRPEETRLYGMLTAELADLTADYRATCAPCGTFITRKGTDTWWIDHLLARRDGALPRDVRVERIRNRRRDEPYSDHDGLWAELRFR